MTVIIPYRRIILSSQFTPGLNLEKPQNNEQPDVWDATLRNNWDLIDKATSQEMEVIVVGNTALTQEHTGHGVLIFKGSPAADAVISIPGDRPRIIRIHNDTNKKLTFHSGTGGDYEILAGNSDVIYSDGKGAGASVHGLNFLDAGGGTINGDLKIIGDYSQLEIRSKAGTTGELIDFRDAAGERAGLISVSNGKFIIQNTLTPAVNGQLTIEGENEIKINDQRIVESGSNANGRWIKYYEGTLIQHGIVEKSMSTSISYGAMFRGIISDIPFPIQFEGITSVLSMVGSGGGTPIFGSTYAYDDSKFSTNILSDQDVSGVTKIHYIAMGRWRGYK